MLIDRGRRARASRRLVAATLVALFLVCAVRGGGAASAAPGAQVVAPMGAMAAVACSAEADPPDTCEAQMRRWLLAREAWAWSLCFDEGVACETRIERQRPLWEAWAWATCWGVTAAPVP